MANTPTTRASVASRLTDEEIAELADTAYIGATNSMQDSAIAAVLRDYVRMRNLVKAVKAKVSDISAKDIDEFAGTRANRIFEQLKRLLAEAKKGETK